MRLAVVALLLVACGDGSSLTETDVRQETAAANAKALHCDLEVAKAVCRLRLGCSGEPPTSCARDEANAFRGLTCSCTDAELAACSADTLGMVCSPTETFGACAPCFH